MQSSTVRSPSVAADERAQQRCGPSSAPRGGKSSAGSPQRKFSGRQSAPPESPGLSPAFSQIPIEAPKPATATAHSTPQFSSSLPPLPLQRKLAIGATNDPLEHEADRVADRVMRMRDPAAIPSPTGATTNTLQRKCSCGGNGSGTCEECKTKKLQRSATASATTGFAPPIVHDVLRSSGQPLDSATRSYFEPRLGMDLSGVRTHTDSRADQSAQAVNALAYTSGRDIVFREGAYAPSTASGGRLLAHELAHVVQQASAPAPLVQRGPGGGQGDQKFFDPSRGPLTDPEKAKLLALRRKLNFPDTPTPGDTTIVGILVTETGEEIPLHSGERGGYFGGVRPADVKGGPGSGTNRINRTHVETWAANVMRQRGLKRAVLLIELEPCAVCGGYGKGHPGVDTKVPGVSAQLPEDAQLIVVDGQSSPTYFRQTPTDPRTPTRGSPKPPKGQGGVKAPAATDADPGGAGAGKSPQVKGQGGVKAPAATDVDPASGGKTGGTAPAGKTTGTPSQPGRFSGLAIEVGTGVATVGLDWLAAYLKQKVDQESAARQVDAFMAMARKQINANPDEAVKKMMADPYARVYAWVYLNSSVITTIGVASTSFEPPTNASAPIIYPSRIDYMTAPVDQSLIESYPKFSAGGRDFTLTSQIVIDIPLTTPPLEDLINYAKARNLPMHHLLDYVMGRHEKALSSSVTSREARVRILNDYHSTNDALKKLHAAFQAAEKLKDAELLEQIADSETSVAQSLTFIKDQQKPIEQAIQESGEEVKYWEHILNLVRPTTP
jgi:hypothetical protein